MERAQLQESGNETQASTGSQTQSVPEVPISAPNPDPVSFKAEYCLNSNSGNGTKLLGKISGYIIHFILIQTRGGTREVFIFLLHAIVQQPGNIPIYANILFSIFLQPHVERAQLQESGNETQASTGSGTQSAPVVPISAPNPNQVSFRTV